MQAAWRMGRLGPLIVYINYTWIFASVLVLWWVALLWMPENFPAWAPSFNWFVAVVVLLLYLFSVIGHEIVHSAIAKPGLHSVNLFPFGAAVPFRGQALGAGRTLAASIAAPLFNLLLGGLLVFAGNAIGGPDGALGWLRALLLPLGWLNIWIGAANLIPGTPFDGGAILSALVYSFSGERDSGLAIAQSLGRVATLALILVGAWRGLATDMVLQALALIVLGWSAEEAASTGTQRRALRALLQEITAEDVMDVNRPADVAKDTDSVADVVEAYPRFPPNTPLAVVTESGALYGVTTIAATERLMQGTWPVTPIRAITSPISEVPTVAPQTPLVDVLSLAHTPYTNDAGTPVDEEPSIPVIQDNSLVGSIAPARLQSFEDVGRQFGVDETMPREVPTRRGLATTLGSLARLLPVIMVLIAMAILGNIALRTDPARLQQAAEATEKSIVFSNFRPADSDIVGLQDKSISVEIAGTSEIVSATIWVDNNPLGTQLTGASPLTQTASAALPDLTVGQHTARISAATARGDRKTSQWRFRVSDEVVASPTEPTAAAEGTPEPLNLQRYRPGPGGRVPAATGEVAMSLDLQARQAPSSGQIHVDGNKLDTKIEPVSGSGGGYRLMASSPALQPGLHTGRVDIVPAEGGSQSASWVFSALPVDAAGTAYFKETGYFVTQPFLDYWQKNGGLGLFGYPVSDLVQETDKATGQTYTAQYFERARFELHPSTGDQVILGRLGALVHEPEPAVLAKDGAQFFPETGHNVSPVFLKHWTENGGLAVFGYPITEERPELNAADGKEYTVQYFERNRFELHPERAGTAGEVQLGLLGAELYNKTYGP